MSENQKSPLIINDANDLPAESISLPLKWNGLDVTYLSTASSRYPIHNHRAIQVIIPLLTSGFDAVTLSAISSRQKSQKLTLENAFVIPAYQPHTLLWNQDTELVMFDLEPEFIERAAGEAFRGSEVEIREESNIRDSFITQLGGALYSEFRSPSAVGRIYIESLAVTLAVHLLRGYSVPAQNVREFSGGLSGAKLRLAIEYIDSNLDQNLSLTNIAETVGMSSYYFSRALKKSTGFAPHAYVVHQRIERAKQLLIETKLPIIDIALAVGYVNHSHFSTQFRKLIGISPTAYREK
ncbi:MAG: AraC family transcriptional regulator [Acidobacteriota bacterium]|nr:AraC family transcriptional regulator [Acidobacteriota bacterium]